MELIINRDMLKEAAENTRGETTETPGYSEIIYNMENGGIWAVYHVNYESWTNIDDETEIKIGIKTEKTAEELEELIRHEIRYIKRNLQEPGATERLPKKWVDLINNIKL